MPNPPAFWQPAATRVRAGRSPQHLTLWFRDGYPTARKLRIRISGKGMLRITVQERDGTWRLTLSGKLAGPRVAETAKAWRSVTRSGKPIEVDLNEVTRIDGAGRSLLLSMDRAGARLQATGVENSALISEINPAAERGRLSLQIAATRIQGGEK